MKTLLPRLLLATTLFIVPTFQSFSAGGYVHRSFNVGDNLFVNPLMAGDNSLSNLFITASVPDGAAVSLWNPTTASFDTTATFTALNGSWSQNLILNPGTGARLTTASSFENYFIGAVLNRDGTSSGSDGFGNPPPYAGPNALLLLGDIVPMANTGDDIFLHLLGRTPHIGEQVLTLTTTSTYLGEGVWDNVPFLGVSEAAFLNVGPVPEPSSLALVLLGIGLTRTLRRKA